MNKDDYTVNNLYVAAVLICKGYKLRTVRKDWKGFGVFVFEDNGGIPIAIEGYSKRKYKIIPKDFVKALKKAKKALGIRKQTNLVTGTGINN